MHLFNILLEGCRRNHLTRFNLWRNRYSVRLPAMLISNNLEMLRPIGQTIVFDLLRCNSIRQFGIKRHQQRYQMPENSCRYLGYLLFTHRKPLYYGFQFQIPTLMWIIQFFFYQQFNFFEQRSVSIYDKTTRIHGFR